MPEPLLVELIRKREKLKRETVSAPGPALFYREESRSRRRKKRVSCGQKAIGLMHAGVMSPGAHSAFMPTGSRMSQESINRTLSYVIQVASAGISKKEKARTVAEGFMGWGLVEGRPG